MSHSFATNRLNALREGLHAMRKKRDSLRSSDSQHLNPSLQRTSNQPVNLSIKNTKLKGGGIRRVKKVRRRSLRNKDTCSPRTCQLLELEKHIFKAFQRNTLKKRLK